MGASGWDYQVPYEPDLQSALDRLRADTFDRGDYLWLWEGEWVEAAAQRPRPGTMADLLAAEGVDTEGTHSIIDCPRIRHEPPATDAEWSSLAYFGTVVPVTDEELIWSIGTDRPTIQDLAVLEEVIPSARWMGRCAILYSDSGAPEQIAFWGASGD